MQKYRKENSKRGVLLINLGSPDSPTVPDVRRYLREFLMDKRVIDAPWPVRFGIVHFGILPKRPRQSAEAYRSVWTAEGSPLIQSSRRIQVALQERLELHVGLAMRYQNPSIEDALRELSDGSVTDVFLIPLFPHYAMSSYETAVERVKEVARAQTPWIRIEVALPYYDHPAYIRALAARAEPWLQEEHDHLLFSFHGLPERHLRKADPTGCHCLNVPNCCQVPSPAHKTCYRAQCFRTMHAFVKETGLPQGAYSIAFQSRLGREPWMQPYTDQEIVRLAKAGVQRLAVICPAFVSDCLETLEEIGIRGREAFLRAGGKELTLVPCLNDHPEWISALVELAEPFRGTQPCDALSRQSA